MARHDQKAKESNFTCTKCRELECGDCIDNVRARLFDKPARVCVCQHKDWEVGATARAEDSAN